MYGVARVAVTARQRDSLSSQQGARWPAERRVMPSRPAVTVHTGWQRPTIHADVDARVALPPAGQLSRACTRTRAVGERQRRGAAGSGGCSGAVAAAAELHAFRPRHASKTVKNWAGRWPGQSEALSCWAVPGRQGGGDSQTVTARQSEQPAGSPAASRAPRHAFKAGRNGPHSLAATNHPRRR